MVDLLVDRLASLLLLDGQPASDPIQRLVANNQHRHDRSLAVSDDATLLILLVLARVDLEDVVAALEGLVVGQPDQALGVGVELAGGLLDDGEALVQAVEGLVAERVGAGNVGRDVGVGLFQPGENGSGDGLVGGVAELDGALAELVGLEGVDAVTDDGVVEEVLAGVSLGLNIYTWVLGIAYLDEGRAVGGVGQFAVNLRGHGDGGGRV